MRRIAKEEERLGEKLVPKLAPKVRRREETRERKALAAAKVERAIERELIERLRSGAYGDQPLNVSESIWKKVLKGLERDGEGVRDEDMDEGIEAEQEFEEEEELEDEEGVGMVEYVSDLGSDEEDLEDFQDWLGSEEEEQTDEDDDEDDSSEEEADKKAAASKKRKLGAAPKGKPKKKVAKMEIEYEMENDAPQRELVRA